MWKKLLRVPQKMWKKLDSDRIIIDYGGANIAKTLHVGHLRSANIGEALKRLAKYLGKEVIADVHFGDIGRQSGMVIYEIKKDILILTILVEKKKLLGMNYL